MASAERLPVLRAVVEKIFNFQLRPVFRLSAPKNAALERGAGVLRLAMLS